ncbi:MAG: hypothetical protein GX126_16140 [Bacteroidales bacterium]|nr:hypothetical protein [Bacteroidales bacterium]
MGEVIKRIRLKTAKKIVAGGLAIILLMIAGLYINIRGRTLLQFDIHQNEKMIFLSTYAEPPQFAIWIENVKTGELQTVFVTKRVSTGDWEGKANVPVALPRWFELFKGENKSHKVISGDEFNAVTGATPKDDYFSVRVEVKPGSTWVGWIEMNLAGDYNETFPELNLETFEEDIYACGQPALLFNDTVTASEGNEYNPSLYAQSVWESGVNRIEPVSEGVTTAREVFDTLRISVIKPRPKFIDKNKIDYE